MMVISGRLKGRKYIHGTHSGERDLSLTDNLISLFALLAEYLGFCACYIQGNVL